MHDLIPLTALGKTAPQIDSHGTVLCEECPDTALASVAARLGRERATEAALESLLGAPAPAIAGATLARPLSAMWTGPDQWLVEAPYDSFPDLATHVKTAFGDVASVTEQSDNWTRFDLSGADVLAVLELLCALDTRAMAQGAISRVSIHHLGCFVLHRAPDHFSVYGPRASAGSLHHALVTAMRAAL